MRNLIIFFTLTFSVLFTACEDWLTVSPRTESPEESMFSRQTGFKDALTGAYLELMHNHSYGEYLSMSMIENLANLWNTDIYDANRQGQYALSRHNYSQIDAENIINNMYGQQYKVILAVNAILSHVDDKKSILPNVAYETIKGECLGIRAMCHLDLMRMFGPVPSLVDESPVLPYVKTVTKNIHPHLSFNSFMDKVFADFEESKSLLKKNIELQDEILDDYFAYRRIRMNYHAVCGLMARAYLWIGEKEEAYSSAIEVIEATDRPGDQLRLGTESDFANEDYAFNCEHVLSIYRFDMYSKYNAMFKGVLFRGTNENIIKNDIFNNDPADTRRLNLWSQYTSSGSSQYYVLNKYKVKEKVTSQDIDNKYIPILRLSELYLIAIETGSEEKVQELWSDFLYSRNLELEPLSEDPLERKRAIMAEYRKEFYGEGCVFYLYKRLNIVKEDFLWAPAELEINYMLPLPKSEIINN